MGLPDEQRRRQWSKRGSRLHRLRGIRERNVSAVEVWQACRARRLVAPPQSGPLPRLRGSLRCQIITDASCDLVGG